MIGAHRISHKMTLELLFFLLFLSLSDHLQSTATHTDQLFRRFDT